MHITCFHAVGTWGNILSEEGYDREGGNKKKKENKVAWKSNWKINPNACRAHDGDGDESLDGLELLKAVLHARGEHDGGGGAGARGGYADEQRGGDAAAASSVSEETFAEVEGDCY